MRNMVPLNKFNKFNNKYVIKMIRHEKYGSFKKIQ